MMDTDRLLSEMIEYYAGDPKRIQHFIKVHGFARLIGRLKKLDEDTLFTLETAAIIHDIGIKVCEEKYGECGGKLQEAEGPAVARELLTRLGCDPAVTERVCYLVGHHHTYSDIDGIDYRILVEADFLVNLFEEGVSAAACQAALKNIFRTESGTAICQKMFGIA